MGRAFHPLALLLIVLSLSPLGCETVPYTGRRQIQLVSPDEETKFNQLFADLTGTA